MALKKDYELESGIVCNYHTPIIMQNNRKKTKIAISSFLNKEAYLAGKEPLRSRVDAIQIDSKYPTAEEIYTKLKESKLEKVILVEAVEAVEGQAERTETYTDEEGNEHTTIIPAIPAIEAVEEVFEMVETNWYADAEDDI
jgi:hypothetical protein